MSRERLGALQRRAGRMPTKSARWDRNTSAFWMQAAAAQLGDLSGETRHTLESYGVDRQDWRIEVKRNGGPGQYRDFSTNCLLARRLVERGVRIVNIFHGFWDHHELKNSGGAPATAEAVTGASFRNTRRSEP